MLLIFRKELLGVYLQYLVGVIIYMLFLLLTKPLLIFEYRVLFLLNFNISFDNYVKLCYNIFVTFQFRQKGVLVMSIRFVSQPELANVITHDGNFHADDIFSLVFLSMLLGDITVFRLANINADYSLESFNKNTFVVDIGYGEFDHHQKGGNGCHPTPNDSKKAIPYATFGLLWKKFGKTSSTVDLGLFETIPRTIPLSFIC